MTYDAVRDAVLKVSAERGRAAAVAVLEKFGTKHAKELAPAQYGAVAAALLATLADDELA